MRAFKNITALLIISITFSTNGFTQYFPAKGETWQQVKPGKVGLKEKELLEVVKFAEANEYSGARDLRLAILKGFAREPYHDILGPTKKRGGPAGMIIKDGYVVAQWGDIKRVDMTFSVTKSYLSTVAGLAVDKGLINNVNDPVINYVWDNTFEGEHNAKITWDNLLTQSSDWSGSLFGSPDWSDRPPKEGGIDDWKYRELHEPGTYFKYNDVRVNVLAYSLLQVWRKPLPQVLKENLMVEHIIYKENLLAIIISHGYREPGIHFFTPDDLSQQLAFMRHPVGKVVFPHVHNLGGYVGCGSYHARFVECFSAFHHC